MNIVATMTIAAIALIIATPTMADAITEYGGFSTRQIVDEGSSARSAVMRAAKSRYRLTDLQLSAFEACIHDAARDPILWKDTIRNAAHQCSGIAKLQHPE